MAAAPRRVLRVIARMNVGGPALQVSSGTAPAHAISRPASMARPTHSPTRWPTASRAIDRPRSTPVDALLLRLKRKYPARSAAKSCVPTTSWKAADATPPHTMASSPARFSSAAPAPVSAPTLSTSAHATPSG